MKDEIEMYGFVYMTTNNINGKKYIGQRKFTSGWERYIGSGKLITAAIKKYGKKNFTRIILAIANSKEELDELEIYYINMYNATKSKEFYNIASGGHNANNMAGKSEYEIENFKKIQSDNKKGEKNPFYGKHHSKETCELISYKLTGKKHPERSGENSPMYNKGYLISGENHPMYGKHHSQETKDKISKSNIGKHHSQETKDKISKSNIGKHLWSDEKKKYMSDIKTGVSNDKIKGNKNGTAVAVICLTTGKIYGTIKEAEQDTGAKTISRCCDKKNKKYSTSGKLEDGTKLEWMFYYDYLIDNNLTNFEKNISNIKPGKKNNNDINSIH